MGSITLFLVSQEIVEWRLKIAHTSDDEQRQDPQWLWHLEQTLERGAETHTGGDTKEKYSRWIVQYSAWIALSESILYERDRKLSAVRCVLLKESWWLYWLKTGACSYINRVQLVLWWRCALWLGGGWAWPICDIKALKISNRTDAGSSIINSTFSTSK